MKYSHEEIMKGCNELTEYADLDGTEQGEACLILIQACSRLDYMSEACAKMIVEEMRSNLRWFRKNRYIKTRTETYTREVTELMSYKE